MSTRDSPPTAHSSVITSQHQGMVGQGGAGQNRAGQGRAGQDRRGEDRTGRGGAGSESPDLSKGQPALRQTRRWPQLHMARSDPVPTETRPAARAPGRRFCRASHAAEELTELT